MDEDLTEEKRVELEQHKGTHRVVVLRNDLERGEPGSRWDEAVETLSAAVPGDAVVRGVNRGNSGSDVSWRWFFTIRIRLLIVRLSRTIVSLIQGFGFESDDCPPIPGEPDWRACTRCSEPMDGDVGECPVCAASDRIVVVTRNRWIDLMYRRAEKVWGLPAGPAAIAMIDDPTAESLEAMAWGDDRMYEECRDRIGGIRVGHVTRYQELGLFEGIRETCGEQFLGNWQVIPPADLHHLIAVIDSLDADGFLEDLRELTVHAEEEGAWVVFLFLGP